MSPQPEDGNRTDTNGVNSGESTKLEELNGVSSAMFSRGGSAQQQRPTLPPKGQSTRLGGLSTTEVTYRIPTNNDDMIFVKEHHGDDTWHSRVLHFLHSKKVQFTLMALLLLDVLILFVELYLAAAYPPCHVVDNTAVNCCLATSTSEEDNHTNDEHGGGEENHVRWRFLAGGGGNDDHHEELCEAPYVAFESSPPGCDSHKNEAVHTAEEVLFYFTIMILTTFLIELCLLMAALTPRIFFKQAFYVFDLFVVTVSMGLELSFHIVGEEALASLGGILVLARIWRFLRIGHGLVEATHEYAAMRHHTLEHYASECEKLLLKHGIRLPEGGPMFETSMERPPPVIHEETSDEALEEETGGK